MHARIAFACLVGLVVGGCGPEDPKPALAIKSSGASPVTVPTAFLAERTNVTGEVTWAVTGGGTISATKGDIVIYAPPPGTANATLTATIGSITASVAIATGPAAITSKTIPGLTAPVTVLYDAQDIPHIKCAATIDCLAVQGYVQARDRFFPMDFLRHVARANLAELIGTQGLSQDISIRTIFMTRAGNRLEDDLFAALDAPTKALLDAYTAGVNAYLAGLRANKEGALPGEYAQLPFALTPADIADWSVKDTLAIARLQQFQLSEGIEEESAQGQFAQFFGPKDPGKITAWIRAAAPTTEQGHTLSPTATHVTTVPAAGLRPRFNLDPWKDLLRKVTADTQAMKTGLRALGEPVGSNNWVVAASKSATKAAMVANDPHLTLQYPPLFHLSVMTSSNKADNLDLAGGAFPGIPGALVGRGAHVGWGVTVVGYDVTDLYLETLDVTSAGCAAQQPCVVFNGAPVPTIAKPQVYKARVGTGAAGVVDVTTTAVPLNKRAVLIVPHHGPVIDASGLTAVSARWTGHEGNTQDVKAIFGLNTAANVDAAITALKGFSTGAQNFVLADDQGHIAYDPHALVPVRKWTTTALAAAAPPWFPVPGDGRFEWGDGTSNCASATATPVPATCWIADDALPQGKDPAKGYFFTANADPTTATDDNNPLNDPPYLSFHWDDSTGFRATRIEERLNALAGKAGGITLADMEALQADHVSRPGKAFASAIAAAPAAAVGNAPELALAQAILAAWGTSGYDCPTGLTGTDPKTSAADATPKVVTDSSGCYLFHAFLRALATNVFADDLRFAGQGVNGGSAIKAMLYMLEPATPAGDKKFCFDVDAAGVQLAARTCEDQVAIALVQAYKTLTASLGASKNWIWGRVHTIKPVSLLALVITNYQPGPYARPGGAFTVDVGNPSLSSSASDFAFVSSGNVRHISVMDPAKPVVRMQLPGPERDGPTYVGGPDLLGQWVKNSYFDFAFSGQIDAAAVTTQSFTKAP